MKIDTWQNIMNNTTNKKRIIYPASSTDVNELKKSTVLDEWISFLRSNYSLAKEVISASPNSISWQSPDGKILSCSRSMANILGYSKPDEIIGKNNKDIFSSDVAQQINDHDRQALELKTAIHMEEHVTDPSGNYNIYLTSKIPFYDQENNLLGLFGISNNVTLERKVSMLEKQLNEIQENMSKIILQEKLALTEKIATIISSELNNPLASLNLALDLIVDNDVDRNHEKRSRNLQKLVGNSKKTIKDLRYFIEGLLFKFKHFKKRLKFEDLFLCSIVESVQYVLDTYPFAENEKRLITFDREDDFLYYGDPLYTKNILNVVLKNALKAIQEEQKGEITITFTQEKEFNKLIIHDTAKGIYPKALPHIFDALVSKDTTSKGSGLGLAFCKQIMLDYGGDIKCESVFGEYTTFTFLFPKVKKSSLKLFA